MQANDSAQRLLAPDELELWTEVFVSALESNMDVGIADRRASKALAAYQRVRAKSFLVLEDEPCECEACQARDNAARKVVN